MNTEKSLKLHEFGPFTFDPDTQELKRDGVLVPLRPRAAKLLATLLEKEGELVDHEQLREALWPDRVVEWQAGLHQAIRDVRIALEDDHGAPRFIANVPRRGYRFVSPAKATNPGPVISLGVRIRYFGFGLMTLPMLFLLFCGLALSL